MRWFNTLALATCLVTVVVAQSTTPAATVRLAIHRQPLIKLAVQPAIASDPLTVAAAPVGIAASPVRIAASPVRIAAPSIYPYGAQFGAQYGAQFGGQFGGQYGPQIWPGYLPQQNWYNPWGATSPYWGGYPPVRRNSWNPYWRRRKVARIPRDNIVTPQVEPQTTSAEVTPDVVEPKIAVVDVADAAKPAEQTNDAANTSAETAEEVPVVPEVPEVPLLIAANPAEAAEEVPLLIAANPAETSDSAAEAEPAVIAVKSAEESNPAEATDASASA